MRCILTTVAVFIIISSFSQDKKWDVADPGDEFNYQTHTFTTSEGTWMNLDVSPDGSKIVFDLLGDFYIMPFDGGRATALQTGIPLQVQPKFSPDGTQISFTSDAGGGDNIWVMDVDGENARQVTNENFRLLNNAEWMPSGNYLVARKHFTSQRSAGAGELWMYHISGGSGIQLTKRKNDQQDVNEPTISEDGKYMYYSEDMYPGGFFQYNKDPNSQIYVIKRYDFEDGETETMTGGPGGAARPTISPDGGKLAFIRRVREKSVLFIRELSTGVEQPVFDGLDKDQQEAWAIFGVYPNFAWTPDGTHLVFWAQGHIHKVDISTLEVSQIPFEAEAFVSIAETLKFRNDAAPDQFSTKVIRDAVTTPDGEHLIFQAVGKLWKKALPDGEPKLLLEIDGSYLFEPSLSRDGSKLVFVSWNDEELGAIHTADLGTRRIGSPAKVTSAKGLYRNPSFSPDGNTIVYAREGEQALLANAYGVDPGIYVVPAGGGTSKRIIDEGGFPMFNKTGKRIFYQTGGYFFGNLTKELKSVNLEGLDEQTHVTSKYANRLVPSPDNNWVAFIHLHQAYVVAMPMIGKTLDLDADTKSLPVSKLSRDAGVNLHWSDDSKEIRWTLGDEYFSTPLNQRFTFLEGSPDSLPPIDTTGTKIGLIIESDKPEGITAFTNARIITMEGDEVIENGTIVVTGNRITALGRTGDVEIPRRAYVLDASGKTIMPGIIDVHAHVNAFGFGLIPRKHWPLYANLAYGVTTAHDPSANSQYVFGLAELIRSGEMVGPRLFSTGIILYGADGDFKAVINSLDDARSAVRRTKAFGAFSLKSYNQPRRDQRQQVIQAAREYEMLVVPEGGSHFLHNMSMIMDGHTGIEHNIPVAPLYKDVVELWSHSRTQYTPTLIVNYGGLNGEYFYYQRDNVWENEKLLKYYPRGAIDSRARHRTMVPEEEYQNGHILVSESAKRLSDAGVRVNLGAHGQLQGLGAHWELWMFGQGGMTNMEALRTATINGAVYLGMEDQIGSIKTGKLADLIVLDGNPLEDLEQSENVRFTMVNGRLYDTETMNEIGNYEVERTKFPWELTPYDSRFDWHELAGTHCSCGE